MHQETVRSRAADDKDDRPCGRHVRLVDGDIHVVAVANLEYFSLGTSFATNRRHGWHMTGCPATNCRTVCLVPRWRCAPCVAARPTADWAWGWAELGSTPAAEASCRAGATRVRIEGRRRPGTLWKTGGWNASLGQPPHPLLLPTLSPTCESSPLPCCVCASARSPSLRCGGAGRTARTRSCAPCASSPRHTGTRTTSLA